MKCIIPIAGLGTRLLPFSKVIPKAMLPLHDKPCIQWLVEEISQAGIKEIIFIYSRGQEMVQEYFAKNTWYDEELISRNLTEEAVGLAKIRDLAQFSFVEQKEQLGDGHAILQAKDFIDPQEAFLVIFGDCLYTGEQVIPKLIKAHQENKKCVVAVQAIDPNQTQNYGIVELNETTHNSPFDSAQGLRLPIIHSFTEKPLPQDAPSNLAVIGRYLLTPAIWPHLDKELAHSGEIRLIDALKELQLEDQEDILALKLSGSWLDTGTLDGLQKAGELLKILT